ncbi:rhomboid family intramembrane serine protease [Mucilaginibacter angelicae]|uniref:Rhomboid family intramembrane serine protease n=1 Tax=Mucilaginibacter angelicae TaxID=869718 RepID=A0ABV6L087_9SPHI
MPDLIRTLKDIPVTLVIMGIMMVTSIAAFRKHDFYLKMILHPNSIVKRGEYYRLATSDFVHNDPMHLLINEVMAFFVCGQLEGFLNTAEDHGSLIFLLIYLLSHFAGVLLVTWRHRNSYVYSSAGASGSILGCMMSFMIIRPDFIAFYLPGAGGIKNIFAGFILIAGLIVYQWRSRNQMMDHELHFYSALGGITATLAIFPEVL